MFIDYIKDKELIAYCQENGYFLFSDSQCINKYFGNRKRNNSECANKMSVGNLHTQSRVVHQHIEIVPTGVAVRNDSNPIARYNHAIKQYMQECNMIQGIRLTSICCPCAISWLYDLIIYFYTLLYLSICCQNQTHNGCCIALFMLLVYIAILILPIISLIVLGLSAIFFLYFWAGVVVVCINRSRLGHHQFTERMVHEVNAPPFPGYVNEYFEVREQSTIAYYTQNNRMSFYTQLQTTHKGSFMAYKQAFVENNYEYITSGKMICFHMTFMIISIIGAIISVSAFPSAYGRE